MSRLINALRALGYEMTITAGRGVVHVDLTAPNGTRFMAYGPDLDTALIVALEEALRELWEGMG